MAAEQPEKRVIPVRFPPRSTVTPVTPPPPTPTPPPQKVEKEELKPKRTIKPGEIYSAVVTKTATTTDDVTLDGDKVPEGTSIRITSFYVADLTTWAKSMYLGIKKTGAYTWFKPANGSQYAGESHIDGELYLVEGEAPAGKIVAPTVGDELILFARGIYT